MSPLVLSLIILGITVFLIITELIRIDLVALLAMLAFVWSGIISPPEARSGFASNAVLAIIGVMVMGRGLYKAGVTEKIATFILGIAGRAKRQIVSTISVTVGVMSGFMQNIGAAALFLPVMMGISNREDIPISSLLMPMGFAALLGGTLTMVGTSSLIVLNDLMTNQGLEAFGLFAVMPIGIALLTAGILYFAIAGDLVLPTGTVEDKQTSGETLLNVWGLSDSIYTLRLTESSPLIGQTLEQSRMGEDFNLNVLRLYNNGADDPIWGEVELLSGHHLVVQGRQEDVDELLDNKGVELVEEQDRMPGDSRRGYLEVVIPARSNLVGQTLREVGLRDTYNAQVVLFFSGSDVVEEDVADREIQAGDTLVLHGRKENLKFFNDSEDFITVTPFEYEPKSPEKAWLAIGLFAAAIGVVFSFDLPISIGFLSGAVAMILTGILTAEQAYRSVEWKVIFLIAGLIPVGIAMENAGTAAFIAEGLVAAVQGTSPIVVLLAVGALTTIFSLLMSNVAATVLLVPLVLEISGSIPGIGARALVLQVGVCAANSFILPTHHVNALLMTPGGYTVSDYLKAGSLLSVIFLTVSTTVIYFLPL